MTSVDPRLLRTHTSWLRALALELAGEEHGAEDLLQDTWLAYLRHPDRPAPGSTRQWLGAVARNLARMRWRAAGRRAARERTRARPEGQAAPGEPAEREELRQLLWQAVMELEPVNREIIVLRFFDALPPREIGTRLGLGSQAVRSRLHRALASLRARLDGEYGTRSTWLAAVPPLLGQPLPELPLALGIAHTPLTLFMKTKLKLTVCILALAATASVAWWASPGETPPDVAGPPPTLGSPAQIQTPLERDRHPERVVLDGPAQHSTPADRIIVQGHVQDAFGQPVANVPVRFESRDLRGPGFVASEASPATQSDGAGTFVLTLPQAHGRVIAENEEWITLLDERIFGEDPGRDLRLIAAPRRSYSGIVVDDQGAPMHDVAVRAVMDASLLRGLRTGIPRSSTPSWESRTDRHGAFELRDVAWTTGTELAVRHGGYLPHREELPADSVHGLLLTLRRPDARIATLRGRVVDPAGEGIAEATLILGEQIVATDRAGQFVFRDGRTGDTILAAKRGFLPARHQLPVGEETTVPLVLVLDGAPLEISGTVVDADGNPIAGAEVWTRDGERLPRSSSHRMLEGLIGPPGNVMKSGLRQQTDGDGRFTLAGFTRRKYLLHALRPDTLEVVHLEGVEAGRDDVLFRFVGDSALRRVAGRVVTTAGAPVPGVRLYLGRTGEFGGRRFFVPLVVDTAVTDAEGTFVYESLCTDGTYLLPGGSAVSGAARLHLDQQVDLENIVIEVGVPRRFQVLLGQPEEADAIEVLDGDEQRLRLEILFELSSSTGPFADLAEGKSEVVTVDDRARWLVLRKNNREVRRVPIQLTSDEIQILRL